MDTNIPHNPNDLSDLERRLSSWRPGAAGLDADAMLFAAGLAAGRARRGRLNGPVLCGLLAALAFGLGAWGLSERAERQTLTALLRERGPSSQPLPVTVVAVFSEPGYTPAPGDYFSLRRQMEQDPDRWLASLEPSGGQAPAPPPAAPAILTPRQRDDLLNQ